MEEYVSDGTLRIEWLDFPYLGQESVNAALAARAAGEQGKFWEYHEILFENQDGQNGGAFAEENLIAFAEDLDLDVERFREDLTSEANREEVLASFEEAQELGITGTPTFVVNGEITAGFRNFEDFSEIIEEAAAEAEQGS